jgi:hypothetical protein
MPLLAMKPEPAPCRTLGPKKKEISGTVVYTVTTLSAISETIDAILSLISLKSILSSGLKE